MNLLDKMIVSTILYGAVLISKIIPDRFLQG